MLRCCLLMLFALGLGFCLPASQAVAQNPFKIFDIFSGEEKSDGDKAGESKKADDQDAGDAQADGQDSGINLKPSRKMANQPAAVPEVDKVESVDQASGPMVPPFPGSDQNDASKDSNTLNDGEQKKIETKRDSQSTNQDKPVRAEPAGKEDAKADESLEEIEPDTVEMILPEPIEARQDAGSANKPVDTTAGAESMSPTEVAPVSDPEFPAMRQTEAPPQRQSSMQPAFFGVSLKDTDSNQLGSTVLQVVSNSPADVAGIRSGDRLISVAGSPVRSSSDFESLIKLLSPGDRIEVELMRGARKAKTMVRLDSREVITSNGLKSGTKNTRPQSSANQRFGVSPAANLADLAQPDNRVLPADERAMSAQPKSSQPNVIAQRPQLGIVVVDGIDHGSVRRNYRTGAVVEHVKYDSPAAAAGLPIGSMIVAANGRRIERAADLVGYVGTLSPGQRIDLTFVAGSRIGTVPVILAAENIYARNAASRNAAAGTAQPQVARPRTDRPQSAGIQPAPPRVAQPQIAQPQVRQNPAAAGNGSSVRQAADFQPVPGNTGYEFQQPRRIPQQQAQRQTAQQQIIEQPPQRPILKSLAERFPRLRRVDNAIDRFSTPPPVYQQPAPQQSAIQPQTRLRAPSALQPPPSAAQDAAMQSVIRQQQQQIEQLNQRLRSLESGRRRR